MATVQVKITMGKKSNCLLLAITESELFNNSQLRLNLFIVVPFVAGFKRRLG